jgi:hypothetical protein
MPQCITCGSELHPERAKKYNYCMAPECQKKNLKGLTMVAIGVNKAADQYLILDEQTQDELASGKFRDQRRGSFGTSVPSSGPSTAASVAGGRIAARFRAATTTTDDAQTAHRRRAAVGHRPASHEVTRRPWSKSQERLALLYNEQGRRPEEIAQKLGLSTYTVTQIILTARNRGKL